MTFYDAHPLAVHPLPVTPTEEERDLVSIAGVRAL